MISCRLPTATLSVSSMREGHAPGVTLNMVSFSGQVEIRVDSLQGKGFDNARPSSWVASRRKAWFSEKCKVLDLSYGQLDDQTYRLALLPHLKVVTQCICLSSDR